MNQYELGISSHKTGKRDLGIAVVVFSGVGWFFLVLLVLLVLFIGAAIGWSVR